MSEQLLGAADEEGEVGGDGAGPASKDASGDDGRVPAGEGADDASGTGAAPEAPDAGALGKARRRRRGSRGGRGRKAAGGLEEAGPAAGDGALAVGYEGGAAGGEAAREGSPATEDWEAVTTAAGAPPALAGTPARPAPSAAELSQADLPAANRPEGAALYAGSGGDAAPPDGDGEDAAPPGATAQTAAEAREAGARGPGPAAPGGAEPGAPAARLGRKPQIGDTLPGSPPLPKKRPRRSGAGGRAPAEGSPDEATVPSGGGRATAAGRPNARQRPQKNSRGRGAGARTPEEPELAGAPDGASRGDTVEGQEAPAVPQERRGPAAQGQAPGRPAGATQPSGSGGSRTAAKASRLDLGENVAEGRSRRGGRTRPLGRYLMVVHVGPTATQIAVLEGRTLIEHYVSRPADDTTQIDGNIYLGRVQNVLPGMEAAFIDIGTPKNAVLYRGDLRYDDEEVGPASDDEAKPTRGHLSGAARDARIEQLLRTGQNIVCQVTKNPIGTKGARLTQEVSLPGRFVVLIPDSDTYGISKRLADDERRRLRKILDEIRPEGHGLIVRTAAEGASADELGRDVARLLTQWDHVQALSKTSRAPQLLYREPDLAVRVIREEFNRDYRGVVIDDQDLFSQVKEYVSSITPELADRVELVDPAEEPLPLFERFRVHEQVHKALDRKVWLPSGGSLIIERTEALTVIDVNTGKNVGTSNLEETVFRNNLEAADEIARQLRLRDIGGIIVIDFIDMEVAANRAEVIRTFREALARDKTRTQVFDISELGLVEMTRKRISEGLVESYSETCPTCGGRGIVFDESLLG